MGLEADWRNKVAAALLTTSPAPKAVEHAAKYSSQTSTNAKHGKAVTGTSGKMKESCNGKAVDRCGSGSPMTKTPGRQRKNQYERDAVEERGFADKDVAEQRDEVIKLQKTQQQVRRH